MYAASVALLDDVVGALVGALAANARMLDDTLIVFSSDNGGCEQLVQSVTVTTRAGLVLTCACPVGYEGGRSHQRTSRLPPRHALM